jgi:hypothetical protein
MKKKIVIFLVVVLILVAGGFFWWQKREIKGSPKDYVIKETPEGKIVENKRAGLKIKVPEEWEAKRIEAEEGVIVLYPSNTEVEFREGKIILPLEKSCIIHTGLAYKRMEFSQIEFETRYTHSLLGKKSEEFEEIIVNNYRALKNTFDTQKIGSGMGINIPYKDKVYTFYLYWADGEKENCIPEFDKFLETVSIK